MGSRYHVQGWRRPALPPPEELQHRRGWSSDHHIASSPLVRAGVHSLLPPPAPVRQSDRHDAFQRSRAREAEPRRFPRGNLLSPLQAHAGATASVALRRPRRLPQSEDGVHAHARQPAADGVIVPRGPAQHFQVAEHAKQGGVGGEQGGAARGGAGVGERWRHSGHSFSNGPAAAQPSECFHQDVRNSPIFRASASTTRS